MLDHSENGLKMNCMFQVLIAFQLFEVHKNIGSKGLRNYLWFLVLPFEEN